MIIDYDRRPGATIDDKLTSLKESIQLALNENASNVDVGSKISQLERKIAQQSSGIVTDYSNLTGKPSIEGVTLIGNKDYEALNLNKITNSELEAMLQL